MICDLWQLYAGNVTCWRSTYASLSRPQFENDDSVCL